MAATITISQSVEYSRAYAGWRPLNIGANNEPAITAANIVLQTILGPPFTWNWNRNYTSLTTAAGTQDYVHPLADFGFIEKASYQVPSATVTNTVLVSGTATYTASNSFQVGDLVTVTGTSNGGGVFNVTRAPIVSASSSQFTVNINNANVTSASDSGTATVGTTIEISQIENILGSSASLGSPVNIAPQIDDNAGNITFRLMPVPDRIYSVGVVYQKRIPSLITSVTNTWAPLPDHYSFIYQPGFAALMLLYTNDPRWQAFNQQFIARILATTQGLDEEERNQFLQTWLMQTNIIQAAALRTQQGYAGREDLR